MSKISNIPCDACGYDPTRTILYTHTEVVQFKWLSGNIINPYGHRSTWRYNSYREGFKKAISSVVHHYPVASTKYARLILTRQYTGRQRDYDVDNLAQGGKPMVDYLKELKIIKDDDPRFCQIFYKQEKIPGKKNHVKITVEGLE